MYAAFHLAYRLRSCMLTRNNVLAEPEVWGFLTWPQAGPSFKCTQLFNLWQIIVECLWKEVWEPREHQMNPLPAVQAGGIQSSGPSTRHLCCWASWWPRCCCSEYSKLYSCHDPGPHCRGVPWACGERQRERANLGGGVPQQGALSLSQNNRKLLKS